MLKKLLLILFQFISNFVPENKIRRKQFVQCKALRVPASKWSIINLLKTCTSILIWKYRLENCKSKDQLVLFELRFKMGKYVNINETSFQKLKILTINGL
jgi:hypothetical protein